MNRISILIFIFALAFAFFIITPGLLNIPFTPLPELKIADVLDLFTPLILIPLYYLLLYFGSNQIPNLQSTTIFLVFSVLWVEGQAMHLAANSIGHWLLNFINEYVYHVAHFYDEILSHIIWHEGGTVLFLFPFSILAAILSLILGRKMLREVPVLTFFLVGYTLAAVLYAGWGIYWGSFPQFSHLGWI
jgi:hypothetical protein